MEKDWDIEAAGWEKDGKVWAVDEERLDGSENRWDWEKESGESEEKSWNFILRSLR